MANRFTKAATTMKTTFAQRWGLLLATAVCLLSEGRAELAERRSLIEALKIGDPANAYVKSVLEQRPTEVIIDKMELSSFPAQKIFLCRMISVGMNDHAFTFFIDTRRQKARVLTGSTDGLSELLRTAGFSRFNDHPVELCGDLLRLFKPNYLPVEVVDPNLARDAVKSFTVRDSETMKPIVVDGGTSLVHTWVLREGRDLVVWSLRIILNKDVQIQELVRVDNVFKGTGLHW